VTTDDKAPDSASPDATSTAGMVEQVTRMVMPGARTHNASRKETRSGTDGKRSVMESSLAPRNHTLPVPNGWYAAVCTADLDGGDIISFTAVDRALVAFRDEDGTARIFDAHCPHLGAHLGGGRIVGQTIKCPYHGWHFGSDGKCVEIPYCDTKIPSKARVRSYVVDEKDGFIYFWYHAGDKAPTYELPRIPEANDAEWTDAHEWRTDMVAALQEMAENNVDYAHLRFVHRREAVPGDSSVFTSEGPFAKVVETLSDGMKFTRHTYGPGIAVLRIPDMMTLLATTTPIDRGTCRLRWHFFFPQAMAGMAEELIEGVTGTYGLQADVPIWRDKVYWEKPVLVKGDGDIIGFRRWYSQFYEDADA
jgi:nitrite reductase/ring-hydroxylating ferredoxin subunit